MVKKVNERTRKTVFKLSCDKDLITRPNHHSPKSEAEQTGWNDSNGIAARTQFS